MFNNLKAEMMRHNIKNSDIQQRISVSQKTMSNKMNGTTEFTFSEISAILSMFPVDFTFEYLFKDYSNDATTEAV